MAYAYRVTLLGFSRHRDPCQRLIRVRVEDRWTRRAWDLSVHHYVPLVEALGHNTSLPLRFRDSERSHASFGPPRAMGGRVLLYDHQRLGSGHYDEFDLGPLAPGDSFLLWTEERPAAPAP